MHAISANYKLYKNDKLFSAAVGGTTAQQLQNQAQQAKLQDDLGNQWVVTLEKKGRAKTSSEIVSDFFANAGSLDGFCKMMKQFAELMQELRPTEAVWERMSSFYGTARNATAPFYLLFTVNTVLNSTGKSVAKVAKAWSDMIGAICINWMTYSKLFFERGSSLAGRVLAGTSFFSDTLEAKEQFVKFNDAAVPEGASNDLSKRLQEERRIALIKTIAMTISAGCGAFAIGALALGSAPVPAAALLTAALGSTVLKNGATFYEYTRDTDLNPELLFA